MHLFSLERCHESVFTVPLNPPSTKRRIKLYLRMFRCRNDADALILLVRLGLFFCPRQGYLGKKVVCNWTWSLEPWIQPPPDLTQDAGFVSFLGGFYLAPKPRTRNPAKWELKSSLPLRTASPPANLTLSRRISSVVTPKVVGGCGTALG